MNTDFLEHIDQEIKPTKLDAWCVSDRHELFETFSDFNEWLETDEAAETRIERNIEGFANPSKAFYAGDRQAYFQAFKAYREQRYSEVLSESFLSATFNGDHWVDKNRSRFEQLVQCLLEGQVVPFIGAGVSVAAGYPTWANHLRQQGRTAGIVPDHIEELLSNGQYETVINEIETERSRDVFIQEIRDVFSKTGNLEDIIFRITELFSDTLITTNYDRIIEAAFDTGVEKEPQVIGAMHVLDEPAVDRTTIIKLHGSIEVPANCILSKNKYDQAYGEGDVNLGLPIPKLLSYYYRNNSLLFLGCSLNKDRTMQVFRAVKESMPEEFTAKHFSIEQAPETEDELVERNAYLAEFGITAIWFETGAYELVESILRHLRNEVRYRNIGTIGKKANNVEIEQKEIESTMEKIRPSIPWYSRIWHSLVS